MLLQEMLDTVKVRTHISDDTKVVRELNSAKDWVYNRVFISENGPDAIMKTGLTVPILTNTRELDIAAAMRTYELPLPGELYGVKQLWLKLPTEIKYTPMDTKDTGDPAFQMTDTGDDANEVATGHPVYYDMVNFSVARFSWIIPAGSSIRADLWEVPPAFDLATNTTTAIPTCLHQSICDKATAQCFVNLDDDREPMWERNAERKIREALFALNKRTEPIKTQPFRRR
jgi:hypothetical protein